jgi:hypothetical protein
MNAFFPHGRAEHGHTPPRVHGSPGLTPGDDGVGVMLEEIGR